MNEVQKMMHSYHQLSSGDRLSFYIALSQDIDLNNKDLPELETEIRFSEGEKCMHCGSVRFVKNGRRPDGGTALPLPQLRQVFPGYYQLYRLRYA